MDSNVFDGSYAISEGGVSYTAEENTDESSIYFTGANIEIKKSYSFMNGGGIVSYSEAFNVYLD